MPKVSTHGAAAQPYRNFCVTHDESTAMERPICRVGQNRIYTPYMTVYLVISLQKIPYVHRIHMVLANPTYLT